MNSVALVIVAFLHLYLLFAFSPVGAFTTFCKAVWETTSVRYLPWFCHCPPSRRPTKIQKLAPRCGTAKLCLVFLRKRVRSSRGWGGILGFLNKVRLAMLSLQKPVGPPAAEWESGPRGRAHRCGAMLTYLINQAQNHLLSFSHISKILGVLPESCDETGMWSRAVPLGATAWSLVPSTSAARTYSSSTPAVSMELSGIVT